MQNPATPPPPPAAPPVGRPAARTQRSIIPPLMVGFVGAAAFLLTLRTPQTSLVVIHYAGLLSLLLACAFLIVRRLRRPWVWWIAVPVVIASVGTWGYFDYSYLEWDDVDEKGTKLHYQDWTWRGWNAPYYRRMTFKDDLGGEQYVICRFTKFGKLHGLRTHNIKDPRYPAVWTALGYDNDEKGYWKATYYWYDEEITEGEWHLRNK